MSLTNSAANEGVLQIVACASALALLGANLGAIVRAAAAEPPVQLQTMTSAHECRLSCEDDGHGGLSHVHTLQHTGEGKAGQLAKVSSKPAVRVPIFHAGVVNKHITDLAVLCSFGRPCSPVHMLLLAHVRHMCA